jgi:thiol-disulfide isomerase/thioredoxin
VKATGRLLAVAGVAALLLFAATRVLRDWMLPSPDRKALPERDLTGSPLPSLAEASGWLNGGPLTLDSLRGHPTVVALWSDTDPECLRALPVLESWHQAYARYGARVVGVHQPDFAFAADSSVPARLARRLRLGFPIALDPAYAIRRLLGGPADGPRLVLADPAGTIVSVATGRGCTGAIEAALRRQVSALHPELEFPRDPVPDARASPAEGAQAPESRVVALGTAYAREGPLADVAPGRPRAFTAQFRYQVEGKPYVPYPVGSWSPGAEGLTAARGGAENFVALRYHAGALWGVLSPPPGGRARLWILSDEAWLPPEGLGADARLDSRGASYVDVDAPRLYSICRGRAGERVVKLSPDVPGMTVHALIVEPLESR